MPTPGYTFSGSALTWPTIPELLQAAGVPTVLIASGGGPAPVRQALSGMATRVTLATPVPAAAL